jgi:hypothetical protein
MEAKSRAVLYTLTEHDYQDESKTWEKLWESCIRAAGEYLETDGGQ